jgi:hypothetical protein
MLSLEFKAIPPPPLSFLLALNIHIVLDCMELLFPAIAATTPTAPSSNCRNNTNCSCSLCVPGY